MILKETSFFSFGPSATKVSFLCFCETIKGPNASKMISKCIQNASKCSMLCIIPDLFQLRLCWSSSSMLMYMSMRGTGFQSDPGFPGKTPSTCLLDWGYSGSPGLFFTCNIYYINRIKHMIIHNPSIYSYKYVYVHWNLRLFRPLFTIQQFLWRDALSTCVNPSRLLESLRDTCSAASVGVGRRVAGCADGICYLQFAQRKMRKMVGLQRIHPNFVSELWCLIL